MQTLVEAHTITVLSSDGDYTIAWDPAKEDEVALAREQFERLSSKGYMIFTLSEAKEFDPLGGRFEVRLVTAPPAVPAATPSTRPRPGRGLAGAKGEVVATFQPEAKRSVGVPRMRGG
jgi:hypothetical protein